MLRKDFILVKRVSALKNLHFLIIVTSREVRGLRERVLKGRFRSYSAIIKGKSDCLPF
jgi:hypothetical protein